MVVWEDREYHTCKMAAEGATQLVPKERSDLRGGIAEGAATKGTEHQRLHTLARRDTQQRTDLTSRALLIRRLHAAIRGEGRQAVGSRTDRIQQHWRRKAGVPRGLWSPKKGHGWREDAAEFWERVGDAVFRQTTCVRRCVVEEVRAPVQILFLRAAAVLPAAAWRRFVGKVEKRHLVTARLPGKQAMRKRARYDTRRVNVSQKSTQVYTYWAHVY